MKTFSIKNIIISSLLILLVLVGVYNCSKPNKSKQATLIGKIINPKKNYIVVSKDPFDIDSDTIQIKNGNKLKKRIEIEKEGLYFLYIFPEFQVFYLKPNDSLAFIINTNEFDESLSFSGTSGFENNLLMNIFLMNEKENYFLQDKFNQIKPHKLNKLLDSFYNQKKLYINNYKKEFKKTSKKFKEITELYNRVSQARIKELYAIKHKKNLPDNFFEYRKILQKPLPSANIPDLIYFAKLMIDSKLSAQKKSINKNVKIIDVISNEIKDENLKNTLYMLYCKNYIKDNVVSDENNSVIKKYKMFMTDTAYFNDCLRSIRRNKRIIAGKSIPNIEIVELSGKRTSLHQVLKKNKTLVAFWDFYYRKNFKVNLEKLKAIKTKYPNINILVLNTNTDDYDEWKLQVPTETNFDFYQIVNPNELEEIFPDSYSKIYLLDGSKIEKSLLNMYLPEFNKDLDLFMLK